MVIIKLHISQVKKSDEDFWVGHTGGGVVVTAVMLEVSTVKFEALMNWPDTAQTAEIKIIKIRPINLNILMFIDNRYIIRLFKRIEELEIFRGSYPQAKVQHG